MKKVRKKVVKKKVGKKMGGSGGKKVGKRAVKRVTKKVVKKKSKRKVLKRSVIKKTVGKVVVPKVGGKLAGKGVEENGKVEKNVAVEKPKRKYKLRITDVKIKKLLDFDHLEELFHLLTILNDDQVDSFIAHYNGSDIGKTKDQRLDLLIKGCTKSYELRERIKDELAKSLMDEYQSLRDKMSSLRKKGIDVYIEDVRSMSIPLKIKMFASTSGKEDYYKVKKMIFEIESGLKPKEAEAERLRSEREAREKRLEKKEKVENSKAEGKKTGKKNKDEKKG